MLADFRPAGWTGGVPGMGTPPPPPAGTLHRQRSTALLVVGIVLTVVAVVAMVWSLAHLITTASYEDDEVVAEGVVGALEGDGGESATFTAGGDDPFTVWIRTNGIREEHERDNVIAATACEADLSTGHEASFQGNRQGQALTIGDDSTVGWFTAAEGQVTVDCHQEPFGRQRNWLEDEHDFVVVRGKPSGPWGAVIALTGSIAVLLLGIGTLIRWRRGRMVLLADPAVG